MSKDTESKDETVRTKERIPKPVVKTFASIVVLLVVFIGSGVAYTWYIGQAPVESTAIAAPVAAKPAPVIKPSKPSLSNPVTASVQYITSPVAPGSNASLNLKTTATAKCAIAVEYNKIPSKDSGLAPKSADDFGVVSWTWTVDKSAAVGKWPIKVMCEYGKKSAAVQADLIVKNE